MNGFPRQADDRRSFIAGIDCMQKGYDAGGVEKLSGLQARGNYQCPPVLHNGIRPSPSLAGQKSGVPQGDFAFTPVRRRSAKSFMSLGPAKPEL